MKKVFLFAIVLLMMSVGAGLSLKAGAQSRAKKIDWKDVPIGVVPTKFGELVNFTGSTTNYAMVFRAEDGALRIIEFRGSKLNPRALLIKREY